MFERKSTRIGKVVSDKMDKTIVVEVERQYKHPLYKKIVRSHKKVKAHDKDNICTIGDIVRIKECRPLSRTKRWEMESIIQKSK